MRFKLLHFTTFVPIFSRIVIDPLGLKIAWGFYLFFTYVLLEHKQWNNYSIRTWYNLQKQSEIAMIVALATQNWITHWIAPLGFLLIAVQFDVKLIHYSIACLLLLDFDLFQMICVCSMIIVLMVKPHKEWEKAVHYRIVSRYIQVTTLICAYQNLRTRLVLLLFSLLLKLAAYATAPDDTSMSSLWEPSVPVRLDLKHIKPHAL